MKNLALAVVCAALFGCASAPKEEPAHAAPLATEPEAKPSDSSDVLARKDPGAPKCPKKAKLVKGKCLLPVEETE